MKVELDNWVSNRCTSETLDVLDASAALSFIRKLDGIHHTLFAIDVADGSLMIGGGPTKFVVVRQNNDGSSESLSNGSTKSDRAIYLCVGGQEGDYPSQIVVEFDLVESVIRDVFAEERDPGKIWIPD